MGASYDAIVVGAGMGGLSAATAMAYKGLKVLVLERHNVPGGYATSFVRGRFEFEVALHQLSGMTVRDGAPGPLRRYLEKIGVAQKLEFVPIDGFHRSFFPGLDLVVPTGEEAYVQTLCDAFPAEADGIRKFVGILIAVNDELAVITKVMAGKTSGPLLWNLAKLPFDAPNLLRYSRATVAQVVDRYVKDPLAKAVLTQTWGYYGLPPKRGAFLLQAAGTAGFLLGAAHYVRGRSQALSNAFVERLEELGGEVRLQCGVERIEVKDGKVTGVLTDTGDHYETNEVVSNASAITTCRDLVGKENIPPSFWSRLGSTTLGPSTINLFLGLAKPVEELGLTDADLFLNADTDFEAHFDASFTLDVPRAIMATCYSVTLPELSPPGTSLLSVTALSHGEPWYAVAPEDYVDTKNRIADGILAAVERAVPGLRDAIEVIEVSTPVTNMRYTGTPGGSIYGFAQPPGEAALWRLPSEGPIPGLSFAGAWTMPGGGFETTMVSGRVAGSKVAARVRKARKGKGA